MRKIWDKIVAFICHIPYDKLLHFIAGLIVGAFFCITLGMKGWCFVPAFFAGFIKEFYDLCTTDKWDWNDLLATLAGGFVIAFFAVL